MLDVMQFRNLVIKPALKAINLYSPAAEELVLGTALQESRLKYLHQLGRGPALGLFQMEPRTHNDIWTNYLRGKPDLAGALQRLAHKPGPDAMITDLLYAAGMCRVHYRRVPAALPAEGDFEGQAAYWKKYYNTIYGAGTEEEYLENWHAYSGVGNL
jgi:hypothetical protein